MKELKPGMLVMLLHCPNKECDAHAGEVHVVGGCRPDRPGDWYMNPMLFHGRFRLSWIREHLRPINDPGPDAVDEMVQLLGSPVKETV